MDLTGYAVVYQFADYLMKEAKDKCGWNIEWEVVFVRIDECPWIGVKFKEWDLCRCVVGQSMSSIE